MLISLKTVAIEIDYCFEGSFPNSVCLKVVLLRALTCAWTRSEELASKDEGENFKVNFASLAYLLSLYFSYRSPVKIVKNFCSTVSFTDLITVSISFVITVTCVPSYLIVIKLSTGNLE